MPEPDVNTGQVRFFLQLRNDGDAHGGLAHDVQALWQRADGSWKDSWLNTFLASDSPSVPAHSGMRIYSDFAATPSNPIIACGIRIGDSQTAQPIQLVR